MKKIMKTKEVIRILVLALFSIAAISVSAKTINFGTVTDYAYFLSSLGIGTTTPSAKLGITPSGSYSIAAGNGRIGDLADPSSAREAATKSYVDGVAGGGVGSGSTGQTLRHNGTSWIANSIIFNNGVNVGIATSSPKSKLYVQGDANIRGELGVYGPLHLGDSASTTIDTCYQHDNGNWVCTVRDVVFTYGQDYKFNGTGATGGYIWPERGYRTTDGTLAATENVAVRGGDGSACTLVFDDGLFKSTDCR